MSMSFEQWVLQVVSVLQWMEHFADVGRVDFGDVFWSEHFLAGTQPADAVAQYLEAFPHAEDVYGDGNAVAGERELDSGTPEDSEWSA